VRRIDLNVWGVMPHLAHVHRRARRRFAQPARLATDEHLAFTMDAVGIGLMIMVLGSYYMWWRLPRKRAWGWLR